MYSNKADLTFHQFMKYADNMSVGVGGMGGCLCVCVCGGLILISVYRQMTHKNKVEFIFSFTCTKLNTYLALY